MEDSSASRTPVRPTPIPLGMSSFGKDEQQQFGRNIRLAMACIEGELPPNASKAMPSDVSSIRARLVTVSRDIASNKADLLELVVRFDEMKGWKDSGATHCAAWMDLELGIGVQLGWEYLRVGRKLRTLSTTTALFRAGKLSWSKVRLICRIANADNEKTLCHAALDASFSEVERLCAAYRWNDDDDGKTENERAVRQWEERSLRYNTNRSGSGNMTITLTLPPEQALAFLNSVEHSLNQLEDEPEATITQRRADAALLMAESSIQHAGRDIATADRYQVIVSVDESGLQQPASADSQQRDRSDHNNQPHPEKRPTINGSAPIAKETARRIACDCSISTNTVINGEPTDIGRKSRIWPAGMTRAIKERDQHCQYPGCSHTNHLNIHHIQHWADDGETSISNGVLLCTRHHQAVHEGGYSIERVDQDEQSLYELFAQQRHDSDLSQFDFERQLRIDRESFETVRKLSPTRYRFRVLDSEGRDVRSFHYGSADSKKVHCAESHGAYDYTRVYYGEPDGLYNNTHVYCADRRHPSFSSTTIPFFLSTSLGSKQMSK